MKEPGKLGMHTNADLVIHLVGVSCKFKDPELTIHFNLHRDVCILLMRITSRLGGIVEFIGAPRA